MEFFYMQLWLQSLMAILKYHEASMEWCDAATYPKR